MNVHTDADRIAFADLNDRYAAAQRAGVVGTFILSVPGSYQHLWAPQPFGTAYRFKTAHVVFAVDSSPRFYRAEDVISPEAQKALDSPEARLADLKANGYKLNPTYRELLKREEYHQSRAREFRDMAVFAYESHAMPIHAEQALRRLLEATLAHI